MEKLQRQLLEGEVAYPENWPERGEDYSRIQPTEWQMLEESERTQVHAANDRIQSSLGELKDLLFMAAALADSDACPDPEEQIDTALQFARIQAQFIFDDIAQAERVKMDVATTNLSGGINIGAADATAPDVLGDAQRERISAATDAASADASARKDWQTVKRGGRSLKRTETIRPHTSPATQHKHPNQLRKDAQGNPVPRLRRRQI
jgi:hypothetical protein